MKKKKKNLLKQVINIQSCLMATGMFKKTELKVKGKVLSNDGNFIAEGYDIILIDKNGLDTRLYFRETVINI